MDELISLFQRMRETEKEHISFEFGGKAISGWTIDKKVNYAFGVVMGYFREQDPQFIQVLKEIEISDEELKIIIGCELHKKGLRLKKRNQEEIRFVDLPSYINQIREFADASPIDWIKWNDPLTCDELTRKGYGEYLAQYYYIDCLYRNWLWEQKAVYRSDQPQIEALYGAKELENGLIEITQSRLLMTIDPPRVYDVILDKTIFTKITNYRFLENIKRIYDAGLIGKLSVHGIDTDIYEGKLEYGQLLEHLERGVAFDMDALNKEPITRLYADCYDDCLWVVVDEKDMTFEELCEEETYYDGKIITQVIHLQYEKTKDKYMITHLDHEYIYYTKEEYEVRKRNHRQKGNANHRMKTFKIDNAKIPMDYQVECRYYNDSMDKSVTVQVNFLYYVVKNFFQHQQLVNEYFEKMIKEIS